MERLLCSCQRFNW